MKSHACVFTEPLIDAASYYSQQTTSGKQTTPEIGAKCYSVSRSGFGAEYNGAVLCAELPLCTVHRCAVCEDSYAPENDGGMIQASAEALSSFGAWANDYTASYITLTSDV